MKPRTGAERYFADRMKDPEYAAAHEAAAERIDEIDRILGFLDQARVDQDLSKAELARRAGLPAEAVRRLFTADHRNPTLDTVLALSRALDVELFRLPKNLQDA
jgi:DNA-binding phage protein